MTLSGASHRKQTPSSPELISDTLKEAFEMDTYTDVNL
jgi:hypothetical protein